MRSLWGLVKKSVTAWQDDYASSMGAALAYYTVFSVAPLLVIVIAVAGFFFGEAAVQGELVGQLRDLLGEQGANAVQTLVKSASSQRKGMLAGAVGVVVLVIGATTIFAELQSALDRIWRVPMQQRSRGVWRLLCSRLLAFGLVLATGFLLLVSLVVSTGITAFANWWGRIPGGWHGIIEVLNIAISMILATGLFAMIYKWMPRAKVAWHDVWIGAAVTAGLFEMGKLLIGVYLGMTAVASAFGAAGSIVVLLLWVYYSAQIFLLGAEFTWVYANERKRDEDGRAGHAATSASQLESPELQGAELVTSRRRS